MKTEKIKLPENHRRSLTSALMTVEQMLFDLEASLKYQQKGCCYEIENDLADDVIRNDLEIIREARSRLCKLSEKYDSGKYIQNLSKIVNARKTRIWEVLMDMKPRKQKSFGEFPKELAKEYERDLDELLSVTEKIIY